MILINVPNFMQPSRAYIFIYDKSIWFLFGITTQGLKDHFIHLINYLPQSHKLQHQLLKNWALKPSNLSEKQFVSGLSAAFPPSFCSLYCIWPIVQINNREINNMNDVEISASGMVWCILYSGFLCSLCRIVPITYFSTYPNIYFITLNSSCLYYSLLFCTSCGILVMWSCWNHSATM